MLAHLISDFQIVETASQLINVQKRFEGEKIIAVDLEADSMYHFTEKVCLIQMAAEGFVVLIDPLKVTDLSPLRDIFARSDIQKIFHGADYDVRSLYRDFGIEIKNLFDTELAARFLGMKGSGLEALLNTLFNLQLDKKYQKTDWSRRPLPQSMVEYAARDVLYLISLANVLQIELDTKGRTDWVKEECDLLSGVRSAVDDQEPLYLRFKGAGKLTPKELAVLETLLQYRKRIARKKDKPLFRVMRNKSLLHIATARRVSLNGLIKAKILSQKEVSMHGEGILAAVKSAMAIPREKWPRYPHKRGPAILPAVTQRIKVLKNWRDAKATALDMDAALVATKAILNAIAVTNPRQMKDFNRISGLRDWQKKNFGEEILQVLRKS